MGASQGAVVGGSLLAVCILMSGVWAMEPAQSGALAQSALPAFLDTERLTDFKAAWQVELSEAPTTSAAAETPGQAEAAASAARAAMKRAEAASREAAAVRRRAEELSRRFSSPGAVTKSAVPDVETSGIVVPAVVAEVSDASADKPEKSVASDASAPSQTAATTVDPKPYGVGGPVTVELEDSAATQAQQAAPIAEKSVEQQPLEAKAADEKPAEENPKVTAGAKAKIPPNPVRAPRAPLKKAAPRNNKVTVASSPAETLPWRSKTAPRVRERKKDESGAFDSLLRSFGWNSQPN